MNPMTISVAEFCRMSSLGRTTAFNLIRSGKLPATRVGKRTLIPYEGAKALVSPSKKGAE